MRASWMIALIPLALACGGGATEPDADPTAGGERAAPQVPQGPPPSYLADVHRVVVRLDLSRVRSSAVGADIASLVRSYPTWRDLLGNSGIDPVRDFDRVVVGAEGITSDRSVIVIRHHLSNEQVRQAVLEMAVERGERPQWRDVEGISVTPWPAPTEVARVLVITGAHEMVVTTEDDLPRVLTVARDHALRRTTEDENFEPNLALEEGTIASVVAQEVGDRTTRRLRYPPQAFQLLVRQDPADTTRINVEAQGTYPDDAAAETARSYYAQQRDTYAGQMLVRAVGLDRPLREATIAAEGNRLDVQASLTEEEVQRVLALMALGQIGGG